MLTTSAYVGSYGPFPRTLFESLYKNGINVQEYAKDPAFDMRKTCHTWLSGEVYDPNGKIHRIGCIEFIGRHLRVYDYSKIEESMINSMRTYFSMLDIASNYDVKMDTVVVPLLGSGSEHILADLMIVPLVSECVSFLKRNCAVKRICFVERNRGKAEFIADYMQKSYNILNSSNLPVKQITQKENMKKAFISYASEDKNIADNLCAKLEQRGVKVWYAPRDVQGAYADAIANAIPECTHFVIILSENSMKSQHVLNEIDLAFQELPANIKFKPLRIDQSEFAPAFKYYLSRQHWMDAVVPPLEERLNEFVESVLKD